jgi:hypothetical protein
MGIFVAVVEVHLEKEGKTLIFKKISVSMCVSFKWATAFQHSGLFVRSLEDRSLASSIRKKHSLTKRFNTMNDAKESIIASIFGK